MTLPNLYIRPVCADDSASLHAIFTDAKVVANSLRLPTSELSKIEELFRQEKPGHHRLVGVLAGQIVAYGLLRHSLRARLQHSGTVDIVVHPEQWRQGIGTQMIGNLLDLAHDFNIWRLNLEIIAINQAARHLVEKFGFIPEGTQRQAVFANGRFQDIIRYAHLTPPEQIMMNAERGAMNEASSIQYSSFSTPHAKEAITIRPAHPDDINDLSALFQHPLVCATTLQMPSQEIWHTRQRMDGPPPTGLHRLVAEDNGRCVGMITIQQRQNLRCMHCGGIGMMVHPDYWRLGIGTQLMAAILDIADNWLGLTRVELDVNTDNPAAIHLYEKFGFEIEGTHNLHALGNGRWADSYFMARIR